VNVCTPRGCEAGERVPCAFYTVADAKYFPGLVALLNSMRLVGHDEPLFVVDAGLTAGQRVALGEQVTLIPRPSDAPSIFLAPTGPLVQPADVTVLVDADIIIVRPLHDLIESARAGKVVGFVDEAPNDKRAFSQWESVLGLGPLRRQPYVNAGLLVVGELLRDRLLGRWVEGQDAISLVGTRRLGSARLDEPFYFADQDVLNALLASLLAPHELQLLEHRLAPFPPFPDLTLLDATRLHCSYADGTEPFLLHHILAKPWLRPTQMTVYTLLMSRLLLASDVAVRLEPQQLPLRLRNGVTAAVARKHADSSARIRAGARRQLGRFGIRSRLAARRARRRRRA
jgi:hypothetical protein